MKDFILIVYQRVDDFIKIIQYLTEKFLTVFMMIMYCSIIASYSATCATLINLVIYYFAEMVYI